MIDKILVLYSKKLPTKVAVAPREIKTSEKPKEKNKDFFKIKFLDFKSRSLSVVPHINETYPGIKGSTHGDIKLIKPARKAIERDIIIKFFTQDLVIYLIFFLGLIYKFYHNHQCEHCQQIFEERTLRHLTSQTFFLSKSHHWIHQFLKKIGRAHV